ncbi:MAG: haloacid dehalogenase-like hydrolase [Clostridia bacterium]|nr:haloacid dehalogenase-like hydrolase [Clostridia bacterium]
MPKKQPIVGLVYDFDKTLSTDDMQNFSFIPAVDMDPDTFWGSTKALTEKTGMEKILSYMYVMIEKCKEKGIPLTKEYLQKLGKEVKLYDGVTTWFSRINSYAEELGVKVEHYIVSSGNKEIIEGTSIAKEFKEIYGCEFLYGDDGIAIWPKVTINYTSKTQFLFRISKGVLKRTDDVKVNSRLGAHRIPFENIMYLGDGLTDIPCMTLVKEKGGKSIAIYPSGQKEKVSFLFEDERVNYVCRGDYSANSNLEKIVKLFIQQISISDTLLRKEIESYNR